MDVKKAELFSIIENEKNIAVVFVHGLDGHPFNTWKKDDLSKCLPELLGLDTALKGFDFYTYGYKTGLTMPQYDFPEIAELLYADIQAQLPDRNIVFVAHSMGGLVVQQYIINLYEKFDSENLKKVKGAIYLSVPFQGAGLASALPRIIINRQIRSLRKANPLIGKLEENWYKYFFRGGIEALPDSLKHKIPQIAFHGAQDRIVSKVSASPLHLDAKIYNVDQNHRSICKVDEQSTVFKHIKSFLISIAEPIEADAMILHIHGYEKQEYPLQPDVELDWTSFFDISTSPRVLPQLDTWTEEIIPQLQFATTTWSQDWVKKGGRVRIYSKLCLPGGLLVGNRFSRTKGAIIEVEHYKQIWSSEKADTDFKAISKRIPGNNSESGRAVLALSVTNNIQAAVKQHIDKINADYRMMINILPPTGPGQESIQNNEQAVAYAKDVKDIADNLKRQGIEEFYLFLNCPFSVAVFVGHHLTALSPIQVFDYAVPGYTLSCKL
ncbi:alpha/beta fold hydrolase [Priestia megaterium]|uniref:alpha/beta fold hydrolase n=1 Tax=Priestia megaterium TaxID=1404 RepID=UPI002FFF9072